MSNYRGTYVHSDIESKIDSPTLGSEQTILLIVDQNNVHRVRQQIEQMNRVELQKVTSGGVLIVECSEAMLRKLVEIDYIVSISPNEKLRCDI